jgi:hypothetical protein
MVALSSRPESMMTTGMPFFSAAATGGPSVTRLHGASTMPLTPSLVKRSTMFCCSWIMSSLAGPCQMIATSPCSSAALRAPAWIDCQNQCVVPLGITTILMRFSGSRGAQPPSASTVTSQPTTSIRRARRIVVVLCCSAACGVSEGGPRWRFGLVSATPQAAGKRVTEYPVPTP